MNEKAGSLDLSAIPVEPLDLSRPVSGQIFHALKTAILKTTLPPGCLVSETEIAQLFGASRTPVREAFTQLRSDGLIETRPSRGNYVTKLSEDRIRDAQFIREALEIGVVRQLCAQGVPDAAGRYLDVSLKIQSRAIQDGDILAFQAEDDRFHVLLASATGRGRMATLLIREKAVLDRLRVLSLGHADRMEELLAEHRAITTAIRAGDLASANRAMRAHLRAVLNDLSHLQVENAEFFQ